MTDSAHETSPGGSRPATEHADTKRTVDRGAREAKNVASDATEAAKRQVAGAVETAHRTAEQSHDVARMGLRAAAEVQGQIAGLGQDQGRQNIKTAARVTDIYRETTESTADDVQALMLAFSTLGRGMQQMQHSWFDLLNKSIDQATRRPQDLLRCSSPVELAEAQRDLYRDGVAYWIDVMTTMLGLMGQTAKNAGRSLEGRAAQSARGQA
ncbi:MAG: hypothetical protein JWO51_2345 [Rhodospirillales bacterium]|nr:hypothetical protein [Rhodospirillales bacterium]